MLINSGMTKFFNQTVLRPARIGPKGIIGGNV